MTMLYKIAEGTVRETHYGLALARLVPLPPGVVETAQRVAKKLEENTIKTKRRSANIIRERRRKLILNLKEHLVQAQSGVMEGEVLRAWLKELQKEFVLRMTAIDAEAAQVDEESDSESEETEARGEERVVDADNETEERMEEWEEREDEMEAIEEEIFERENEDAVMHDDSSETQRDETSVSNRGEIIQKIKTEKFEEERQQSAHRAPSVMTITSDTRSSRAPSVITITSDTDSSTETTTGSGSYTESTMRAVSENSA